MKQVLPQCFIACLMFNGIAMEKPVDHSRSIITNPSSNILKTKNPISDIKFIKGEAMESMENYLIEGGLVAMDVVNKIFLDGQWLKNQFFSGVDSIQMEMFLKFLQTGRFSLCDFLLFWELRNNCDGLWVLSKSFPLDLLIYVTTIATFLMYRSKRTQIFQWCENLWLTNFICDIFLY